ncbi:hypothetical protein C2E23DRAFT_735177 [Lenzites betulinus]|nr:hypothetical protein C2E23DRAFT_735177 [Lenzites betulinus]
MRAPTLHNPPPDLRVDDFLTVHHPHSKLRPTVQHFEDFVRDSQPKLDPSSIPRRPWEPFRSRIDFEFAQFALEAALNNNQIDRLLKLIGTISTTPSDFSFKNAGDVKGAWDVASHLSTSFKTHTFTTSDKDGQMELTFHYRSVFEWSLRLLEDPLLAPKFRWHAQRLYKNSGDAWDRFIDEPHTADTWWDTENKLPPEACPLGYEIYADKTRLSSFGTQKGYPIMARVANLPSNIRKGTGFGGAEVVGFLPIASETKEGTKRFVALKRVIWHDSFWILLQTVAEHAKTGYKFRCGDGVERLLYPFIIMLVADYEEQSVMALIRGVNGLAPCPVCIVPQDQQSILGVQPIYPLRQHSDTEPHLNDRNLNKRQLETIIKPMGIRPIVNTFWKIPRMNVYQAVSWDRLHAYHGGLFSDHLFVQFQEIVKEMGKKTMEAVNERFDLIPRWKDMNHFSEVCSVTFTDGTKYEDISKVLVHASYKLFKPAVAKRGHLLLRCIRRYVVLDMIAGLEVQTESTLRRYAAELVNFSKAIQIYHTEHPDKSWNFPKMHTHQHLIQDVLSKGITKNYNTKPFEKMHGHIKSIYADQTNFKNIEDQITRIQHHTSIAGIIQGHLDAYDGFFSTDQPKKTPSEDSITFQFGNVYLGARQAAATLAKIEQAHSDDPAFTRFRPRLEDFVNYTICFGAVRTAAQGAARHNHTHQIVEARYIKVDYESQVDWTLLTDHLRCNPSFQKAPRYDHVIYKVDDNTMGFAQLLFVFAFLFQDVQHPVAMVRFLDIVPGRRSNADNGMELFRVRRSPRPIDFIRATSIVRGVLVMEDLNEEGGRSGDSLLVDTVDSDIFIRLGALFTE